MFTLDVEKYLDVRQEMKKFLPRPKGFGTRALHEAQSPSQWSSNATMPPIHLTSTYKIDDIENMVWVTFIFSWQFLIDFYSITELGLQSIWKSK